MLTNDEENYIKDLYQNKLKQDQIKILKAEMWADIENNNWKELKRWDLIKARKQKFYDDVAAL